jgi:uncharacterized protein (TIGR03437 family)
MIVVLTSAPAYADDVFSAREFLYTRQFRQGQDLIPSGFPLALGADGVYVAGSFFVPSALPTSSGPNAQAFVRKYDASGNEIWTRPITTLNTFPSLMAADSRSLYVAGSIGFGNTDLFVRKLDASGNELWSRQARISEGAYHVVTGLALDTTGVYVAVWGGFSLGVLKKYSPDGDELWSHTLNAFNMGGLAVDASGLYAIVWSDRNSESIHKLTAGGNEIWVRPIETDEVCACSSSQAAVAVDATGIYLAGAVVSKLDLSGNLVWKRRSFPTTDSGNSFRVAALEVRVAALDATSLYVAGSTGGAAPGQCKAGNADVFVRKYDLVDGTEQWTRQFGTAGSEYIGGVAAGGAGVYVAGGIRGGPNHANVFLTKLPTAPAAYDNTRPQISQECVVNAASYAGGGLAPGEIVTIFGTNMGPDDLTRTRIGDDARLLTTLADTRILFNGIPAPLLYVSKTQSSAIVPYGAADAGRVSVVIEYRGARSDALTLPVAVSRPGVFTVDASGYGQAAVLNADLSVNSGANPAERGSIIVLYLTGEGLTDPVNADGAIIGATIPKPRLPVSVSFEDPNGDGQNAEVLYAGAVRGSVAGLLQVNVRVPTWAGSGSSVAFYVQIGAEPAETGFTVALR